MLVWIEVPFQIFKKLVFFGIEQSSPDQKASNF